MLQEFDASTGEIHKKLEENLPPKYQDVLVNDIRFSPKNEKIVGLHPPCPQEVLKIHDGCFTGASL
jgi:1-deoxy-D-xylulose-5-phosphate synthase